MPLSLKDQHQALVVPQHARIEEIRKLESSYAQTALTYLYAINGGALASIPVISAFFDGRGIQLPLYAYIIPTLLLLASLFFTLRSNIYGYRSLKAYREGLSDITHDMEQQVRSGTEGTTVVRYDYEVGKPKIDDANLLYTRSFSFASAAFVASATAVFLFILFCLTAQRSATG